MASRAHPLLPADFDSSHTGLYGDSGLLTPKYRSDPVVPCIYRCLECLRGFCSVAVALFALFVLFLGPPILIYIGCSCIFTGKSCPEIVGESGAVVEIFIGMVALGVCITYTCSSTDPPTFCFRVGIAVINFSRGRPSNWPFEGEGGSKKTSKRRSR
ncbi:hypothetical protein AAMO2058_000037100 [Amorphochlora amoebiformis]